MQSHEKSISHYGEKRCDWCLANNYKRVRKAKHRIFDQFSNDYMYLCDKCYNKWKELNNIIIDLIDDIDEYDD
jgi:hypothetical protein